VIEVAIKVRDTVAGLVGALHHIDRATSFRPLVAPVFERRPRVLLWLEQDRTRQQADPTLAMRRALAEQLSWLTPHVFVVDGDRVDPKLDLNARRIPGSVFELRELMKKQRYISRDDFCDKWPATLQDAGVKLKKLRDNGFLLPAEGKNDRFTEGPLWHQFYEEPGEPPR
jgi:hypothetical protein